jgi:leader peptidase (prepilin peptidase)/N-methyltransferase
VFFTDIDHWIIPDEVNLFGVLFGCLVGVFLPIRGDMDVFQEFLGWSIQANFWGSLLGVFVGVGFFRFIQLLGLLVARQEAMGDGDVKYAAVLGAFLGWQMALAAFFLSFLLGALYAVPLLLSSKGRGKDPVPFGTFMSLAAVPVALWGDRLFELFLRLELY